MLPTDETEPGMSTDFRDAHPKNILLGMAFSESGSVAACMDAHLLKALAPTVSTEPDSCSFLSCSRAGTFPPRTSP